MNKKTFELVLMLVALCFVVLFCLLVIPALIADFDIVGAFAAGFVNPYSSGYSADVILCWVVLLIWVRYEAKTYKVQYGWVCLLLGIVPGVVVGFALYLVMRNRQLRQYGLTKSAEV